MGSGPLTKYCAEVHAGIAKVGIYVAAAVSRWRGSMSLGDTKPLVDVKQYQPLNMKTYFIFPILMIID